MWRDAQARAYERHWPHVARLLGALPLPLFRLAKLVEYDLALRYSDTGQIRDVFVGVDQYPILSIGSWLLDDLRLRRGEERELGEHHLFVAGLLLAARTHIQEAISEPDSFYDGSHVPLLKYLAHRAADELERLIPRPSPFWDEPETGTILDPVSGPRQPDSPTGLTDPDELLPGRWSAPSRLLARAAARVAERDEIAGRLSEMLDALASAFQIRDDLASMHRDLQRRRRTYPILTVVRAAGIRLDPWPEPTVVLGAMVASGSLQIVAEAALDHAQASHRAATELELPIFAAFASDVVGRFEARVQSLSGAAHQDRGGPLVHLVEPTLRTAVAMAEGYLLSDPTLRESWEVHREGMFGSRQVTSRFPAGLVLEMLCAHGHILAEPVDAFLSFTDANRFRYYDHPWSDADTDTIGVYLRLQAYATGGRGASDTLEALLGCLEHEVRAAGSVPVWLRECEEHGEEHGDEHAEERPPVVALGEGCGTVAAHLLLGLMSAGRLTSVVEVGAQELLARIEELGPAANVNYPPTFALAAFLRLLTRLEAWDGDLSAQAAAARPTLIEALVRRRRETIDGAQDAALLLIACHEADRPDLVDPRSIPAILKRQRFDGSWQAEPFAAAPNRGGSVTWYSSNTLTSALCYDAIKRHTELGGA